MIRHPRGQHRNRSGKRTWTRRRRHHAADLGDGAVDAETLVVGADIALGVVVHPVRNAAAVIADLVGHAGMNRAPSCQVYLNGCSSRASSVEPAPAHLPENPIGENA
jgi:hypothetical protein